MVFASLVVEKLRLIMFFVFFISVNDIIRKQGKTRKSHSCKDWVRIRVPVLSVSRVYSQGPGLTAVSGLVLSVCRV